MSRHDPWFRDRPGGQASPACAAVCGDIVGMLAHYTGAERRHDSVRATQRVACATVRAMCGHCALDPPTAVHCVVHCFGSLFGTLFLDTVPGSLFIKKKKK